MVAVNYLWNPINDNIVREFDDSGNSIAEYTTEPDLYGNVVSQYRNGQTSYLVADGQGNTTELTNDAGNVTDTIRYSAFGEVTQRTGTSEIPFQYVGHKGYYRDAEAPRESYSVRRRPLSGPVGRWVASDPAKVTLTWHGYRYASNNPIIRVDPSGLADDRRGCAVDTKAPPLTDDEKNIMVGCRCYARQYDLRRAPRDWSATLGCFDNEVIIYVNPNRKPPHPREYECGYFKCVCEHESFHKEIHNYVCSGACGNLVGPCEITPDLSPPLIWALLWTPDQCRENGECDAYKRHLRCVLDHHAEVIKTHPKCEIVGQLVLRQALDEVRTYRNCKLPDDLKGEIDKVLQ